ncbi:MAG TPA: NusG domain II-containing protein [Oscillospiraceae bacterium]|nr:NusG domain II-containing protein [Oscillospiraceae bacterium]
MTDIPFIKKRDIIILSAIFILCISFLIFPKLLNSGETAEISIDGEIVKTISLEKNDTFKLNSFTIDVRDGAICVLDSPCHDKICVHTGYISKPSQTIVCLPERLIIKIKGEDKEADLSVG